MFYRRKYYVRGLLETLHHSPRFHRVWVVRRAFRTTVLRHRCQAYLFAAYLARTSQLSPLPCGSAACARGWGLRCWLSVVRDNWHLLYCGRNRRVCDIYVNAWKNRMELYLTVRCIRQSHNLPGHDEFESKQLSRQQPRESSTSVITRGVKKNPQQPTQVLAKKYNALRRVELKFEQNRIESSVFFVEIMDRKETYNSGLNK